MESPQNIKKRLKSVHNINKLQTLDIGAGFAILKMFNLTAFLRASGRRQFFYGE